MTHLSTPTPILKPLPLQARIIDERRDGIYTVYAVQLATGTITVRSTGWHPVHRGSNRRSVQAREFWLVLPSGNKTRMDIFQTRSGFRLDLHSGVVEYSSMTRAIEQLALEWAQQYPDAVEGVA